MSNRQFFKRRSFIFLLIGILVGSIPSALFVAAQSGTPTTYTISAGQSPGAPDWTVYVDGGYYWAKNKYGALQSSTGSTNASYVINTAISALTNGRTNIETVELQGNITLTAPIVVYNYTGIKNSGTVWQPANSDFTMVKNHNQTHGNSWIEISGGRWIGGYNGSIFASTNDIFQIVSTTSSYYNNYLYIHDMIIGGAPRDCLHFERCEVSLFHNLWSYNELPTAQIAQGCFTNFTRVSDSQISNVNGKALWGNRFMFCTANQIDNIYWGGGQNAYWGGCFYNEVNNFHVDSTNQGLVVDSCYLNVVTGLHVSRPIAAAAVGLGLVDSFNNTFTGGFIGIKDDEIVELWATGIAETGTSATNIYNAFMITQATAVNSTSATSHLTASFGNGVWIP